MNDKNFYTIHGWMINQLGLRGNDLLAYAIIYGFSQDGRSSMFADMPSMAAWIGCTERGALNIMNRLLSSQLVVRTEEGRFACNCPESFSVDSESFSANSESFSVTPYNININKYNKKENTKRSHDYLTDRAVQAAAQRQAILGDLL